MAQLVKEEQAVGDKHIKYYKSGNSDDTLLFFHGGATPPTMYQNLLSILGERFKVIAPMMYGIPITDANPRSMKEYAELTYEFCRSLGIQPKAFLGHSFGAAVSLVYAKAYEDDPTSPEYIVSICPPIPGCGLYRMYRGIFKILRDDKKKKKRIGISRSNDRSGKRSIFYIPPYLKHATSNIGIQIKISREIKRFRIDRLNIAQRLLVLHCEHDQFFDLDQDLEGLITEPDNIDLDRIDADHLYPFTNPEDAARRIFRFVGDE
ncbi:MAG: alpha/beta hydrolase [Candidatus Woesearchaeota archaeon]